MEITYEQFIKTIPKETAEFINQIIPYFYRYFDHLAFCFAVSCNLFISFFNLLFLSIS